MHLIGLMTVRNEDWCLPASLPAALRWLDELIIHLHASTDRSAEIVRELDRRFPDRIHVTESIEPDWNEASDRQSLLSAGRLLHGTHFAILDADEILAAPAMASIRDRAQTLQPSELLCPPWLQCWRSIGCYRADETPFGRARAPLLFRDGPGVEYSSRPDGYQFHSRVPSGVQRIEFGDRDQGGLLHLQHAVWRRVKAKQVLYQMTEHLRWPGRRPATEIAGQYSRTLDEIGLATREIPSDWWPVDPSAIDLQPVPWQEAEIQHLLVLHGRDRFAGLNLLDF